jgi:hypothetical protein
MPGAPLEMPSETVIVPNVVLLPPAFDRGRRRAPAVDVHVARSQVAPRRGEPMAGLKSASLADSTQHRAAGRLAAIDDCWNSGGTIGSEVLSRGILYSAVRFFLILVQPGDAHASPTPARNSDAVDSDL